MADSTSADPVIAGAGPVGLAAAVFLRQAGISTRLIEKRKQPSTQSRALAVNPRMLELLEPTGVTEKILQRGLKVRGGIFWRRGQILMRISFDSLHHKYPFLVALSQATTEQLLEETLQQAGGAVERNVELLDCRNVADGVDVKIRRGDAEPENLQCPWLLGADGAHSAVRGMLNIPFPGSTADREFYLLDIPLETPLAEDHAHVFMQEGGGLIFCFRVVTDAANPPPGAPLWRVIGTMPDPIALVPECRAAGQPVWSSRFRVEHRIADQLAVGRVYLAGDAAHLHSPIGARGMNLGIEDAWSLAQLLQRERLGRYGQLRREIDMRVVRQIEKITWVATGYTPEARFIRHVIVPTVASIPVLRDLFLPHITGLDHSLDSILRA
jgi:2-polyprenyl-6-methoxyphenol hydroxylase-like FAD-dependent oxidoreductase